MKKFLVIPKMRNRATHAEYLGKVESQHATLNAAKAEAEKLTVRSVQYDPGDSWRIIGYVVATANLEMSANVRADVQEY